MDDDDSDVSDDASDDGTDKDHDEDTTIGPPWYDYSHQNVMGRSLASGKTHRKPKIQPAIKATHKHRRQDQWHRKQAQWHRTLHHHNWEQKFQELVKFKNEHGHTRVPKSDPTLGGWVHTQQKRLKNPDHPRFIQYRHDQLNSIGFEWNPPRGRPRNLR